MTTQIIGVREFRQNLTPLYKKAQKKKIRYVVMNKNRPVFEVRPIQPKSEIYLDSFIKDIAHARQQVREGKVHTLEEVEKHFGIKH